MKPTLKARMVFWIWGISLIVFSLVLYADYRFTKEQVFGIIQRHAENTALYSAGRLEDHFITTAETARITAVSVNTGLFPDSAPLRKYIARLVLDSPEIYGLGVIQQPGFAIRNSDEAPYYYEENGSLKYKNLAQSKESGYNTDWYQNARKTLKPSWSEPYYRDDNVLVTYSEPLIINSAFQGAVITDLSLKKLSEFIKSIETSKTGYVFLVSSSGKIIWSPDEKNILRTNLFDINKELARRMTNMEKDCIEAHDPFNGEPAWIAFTPVPSAGYSLAVVYHKKDAAASLKIIREELMTLGSAGMLLQLIVIIILSSSISKPVARLAEAAGRISAGDLGCNLPRNTRTLEVFQLEESFQRMMENLNEYVEKVREVTAAQQKTESELDLAKEIQMSVIPSVFPPFPQRKDIDIFAKTLPDRKVGGDFYDFYLVDDSHLAFIIGDASGKGVPAAIFMAVFRSVIKAGVLEGSAPHQVIKKANDLICGEDYQDMFITAFLGILDTSSGVLTYCNGGHNRPYFVESSKIRILDSPGGPAPGISERSVYTSHSVEMGETLFLYTDGVTEAMNVKNEEYGRARLEDTLKKAGDISLKDIIGAVETSVGGFAGGAPQSDDITMMALSFRRAEKTDRGNSAFL